MTLKLNGSTSGSVSIDAPASTAGGADRILTLPDDASNGIIKTSTYPSAIQVLEEFFTPCDGAVIATSNGNITIGDVDAAVEQTTSYVDVPGSSITYTPPTGATQVIYKYRCQWGKGDTIPLLNVKLFLDSDEVSDARCAQYAAERDNILVFEWGFNIGGSAVTATGRVASWTSGKTIKLQAREYGASNEARLFSICLWEGSSDQDVFSRPSVGITAIG